MICWILSRPISNIHPLGAALKLVGGKWAIFRFQLINSRLVCVDVLSDYARVFVGIVKEAVEVDVKTVSACVGVNIRGNT